VQAQITRLGKALATTTQAGVPSIAMKAELTGLVTRYDALATAITALAAAEDDVGHDAHAVADRLRPAMAAVRTEADALEHLVADELWPLPKYREMLLLGV